MFNLFQTFLMLISAALIAVADSIIKKVSSGSNFSYQALFSLWMFFAYFLYFVQILIAVYIFTHGGELPIYVILYIIFYSILGILSGILIFNETITLIQGIGAVLVLLGAVLINVR